MRLRSRLGKNNLRLIKVILAHGSHLAACLSVCTPVSSVEYLLRNYHCIGMVDFIIIFFIIYETKVKTLQMSISSAFIV